MSVLLMGTWLACGRKETTPDAKLHDAYAALAHRPFELRLVGFPDRPFREERNYALQATSQELLNEPIDQTDVRLRAAALAFLGRTHDAISLLQTALHARDTNAALWNDLAVHHFESARHGDDPRAVGEALAAVDRAIALDKTLPEPRLNRAAILQAMHLGGMASSAPSQREAWDATRSALEQAALTGDVARVDSVVAKFAQEARTAAEGPMLATWAEFHLAGEVEAATKQLSVARSIGDALLRINREPLLHDAVAAIDRAETPRSLANAYVLYKQARLLIHERKPGRADAAMAQAERLFRARGSPMDLVAHAYRVGIAFDRNRISEAESLLDSLERRLPPGYTAMRAQVQWDRGRIASRRGDVYALLRHAETAATLYEQLHEHEFTVRMRSFIASAFTSLGRADDAWNVRLRTFADAERSGNPDLVEHVLHAAAKDEILEKRYDVAASLFGVMLAETTRSPVRRFEALLWQAFVASRARHRVAIDTAGLAAAAAAIEDEDLRASADADRWFAEALLIGDARPEEAITLLTQTIKIRERRGLTEVLPEAYVARGRLHRRRGAVDDAERDLGLALTALERRREKVEPLTFRDSFFAAADAACSESVELYAGRRDFANVFLTAERCRARTILDIAGVQRRATRALMADEVRRRLPDGVTLLHYISLRDTLLVTSISRSTIKQHLIALPRVELERNILALTAAMQKHDETAIDRLTRALHASLIGPDATDLKGQQLAICPDEVLAPVPFAALQNAEGRYLIEDVPITIATSATSYVIGGTRSPHHVSLALLVGDPAFDSAVHALPRLPAAAVEARELVGVYRHSALLTGNSATPERFLREVGFSDVVHVAAHAIVSPRDAALSTLVFAPARRSNGLVYQSTVAGLRLTRKPLVVLAGCRTASAAGGRGSIRSLALAFLAAGSRGVVGSLWDIEDDGTRALSRSFHRRLAAARAADALRNAQLEMLHANDRNLRSPAVWAAFQFIGYEEGKKDK